MVTAATLLEQLRLAVGRPVVRERLVVPDADSVSTPRLHDYTFADDSTVAGDAATGILLLVDNWPLDPSSRAALVVAAGRARNSATEPVVDQLQDPRLLVWLTDRLTDTVEVPR